MYHNSLNPVSLTFIDNIVRGFHNIPAYQKYEIRSYLYDPQGGIHAIMILNNDSPINLFLFYPGAYGEINSIAIFGNMLESHLNAIQSTMSIFGMPISHVSLEMGQEPYVDVYLKNYK